MRRCLIFSIYLLLFLFASILLPAVSAETFKLGKKVSETDEGFQERRWYFFDTGCIVLADSYSIQYMPLIFDGNLSTGLDNNSGKYNYNIWFEIQFPYTLNISKISVFPYFNGSTSWYSIGGSYRNIGLTIASEICENITFNLNGSFDKITITIRDLKYTHHPYENTTQFYFNDVIIEYTPDRNNNNQTQQQINKLNQEINKIKNEIASIQENITELENSLSSTNQTNSGVKGRVVNLEAENLILNQKIGNLSIKIENLTTQLNKLESEVQNLKGLGVDKNGGSEDDPGSQYLYFVTFGIILIILLLIILKLFMTIYKRRSHDSEYIDDLDPDDELMNQIEREMKTNGNLKAARLYDDKYKNMVDDKFGKGEMSEETYNYIKSVLEVPDSSPGINDKKT